MTSKYKVLKVKTDNQDIALIKRGNKYLCLEISKVQNDKWITVKPHGDEEKGRHLRLEGDETPKEAMKRQWGVDVDKKKEKTNAPGKDIKDLTFEELESNIKELRKERKVIYDEITENIRNNLEYKNLIEKKERIEEEYFSLSFDNPLKREKSKELDSIQDEIRHTMYRLEDEEREKRKDKINKLNSEIDKFQNEQQRRHLEDVQKQIEKQKEEDARKAKEAEERKQKAIIEAKVNYLPKEIAGVTRSKEMTNEEANGGAPNPNYRKEKGYDTNCQSCVVCYEMRKRGYNVTTLANIKGSALEDLSYHYKDAWVDMETGMTPIAKVVAGANSKKVLFALDKEVKEGERYSLRLKWKKSRYGHVVNMFRENGVMILYDPQNGKKYTGDEIEKEYLSKSKGKGLGAPELLRIDNLSLNPKYMNKIVKSY